MAGLRQGLASESSAVPVLLKVVVSETIVSGLSVKLILFGLCAVATRRFVNSTYQRSQRQANQQELH